MFFLRSKTSAEICAVFREFKASVELKHRPNRIARFRCDNGKGEYDNQSFRSILAESGISYEPSPPYTQHKNGVSERMIQTHNAKARAMMLDSCLPASMWAEAVNTANYLHARSPTAANKGMTPYEKLHGTKPAVAHIRRFGCTAYRMLPAAQRSNGKFGSRAETLHLLGYVHDNTTIWRFWDQQRRRVIEASNVQFDELARMDEPASLDSDPFQIDTVGAPGAPGAAGDGAREAADDGVPSTADTGAPRVAEDGMPRVSDALLRVPVVIPRVPDALPRVPDVIPRVPDGGAPMA